MPTGFWKDHDSIVSKKTATLEELPLDLLSAERVNEALIVVDKPRVPSTSDDFKSSKQHFGGPTHRESLFKPTSSKVMPQINRLALEEVENYAGGEGPDFKSTTEQQRKIVDPAIKNAICTTTSEMPGTPTSRASGRSKKGSKRNLQVLSALSGLDLSVDSNHFHKKMLL